MHKKCGFETHTANYHFLFCIKPRRGVLLLRSLTFSSSSSLSTVSRKHHLLLMYSDCLWPLPTCSCSSSKCCPNKFRLNLAVMFCNISTVNIVNQYSFLYCRTVVSLGFGSLKQQQRAGQDWLLNSSLTEKANSLRLQTLRFSRFDRSSLCLYMS